MPTLIREWLFGFFNRSLCDPYAIFTLRVCVTGRAVQGTNFALRIPYVVQPSGAASRPVNGREDGGMVNHSPLSCGSTMSACLSNTLANVVRQYADQCSSVVCSMCSICSMLTNMLTNMPANMLSNVVREYARTALITAKQHNLGHERMYQK